MILRIVTITLLAFQLQDLHVKRLKNLGGNLFAEKYHLIFKKQLVEIIAQNVHKKFNKGGHMKIISKTPLYTGDKCFHCRSVPYTVKVQYQMKEAVVNMCLCDECSQLTPDEIEANIREG